MVLISQSLKQGSFIVCKPNLKNPYTEFEGDDWNNKKITYLEANKKLQEGFNIGFVAGDNDFFVIDCDTLELEQACNGLLPPTYTERTCSGGSHYIYRIEGRFDNLEIKDTKRHYGEIRANRQYVVIAPSKAKNKSGEVKPYIIESEIEIPYVSKEQIKEVILKFMPMGDVGNTIGKLTPELKQRIENDEEIKNLFYGDISGFPSRSEAEQSLVNKLVARDFTKSEIFVIMANSKINKWNEKPLSYRELTYNKAVSFVTNPKKKTPVEDNNFNLMTYLDFKNLRKNKNYIVDGFLFPETTTMIYSPPAMFKSLLVEALAMSISNGRDWMGLKTKKNSVLYLDGENSNTILKERLVHLHKGMRLRRNNFPFYVLKNGILIDSKKNLNLGFMVTLERIIEEKKIKVLIFDTMHRFAYYDENRSDDINLLYTQVFKPLIERFGISIIFLHHSRKDGGYRGSGDFLGMVDVCFQILRKHGTNRFIIKNEKNRSGEISSLIGEIDFGEDYMRVNRLNETEEQKNSESKQKQITEAVLGLFEKLDSLRRKDIIESFDTMKFDYGSVKSVDRALKFLVEVREKLIKNDKGVYTKRE